MAKRDLTNDRLSENQVQAIFIKTANSYPQCDLSGGHCLGTALLPDAYKAEQQLGNILRYLKCCKSDGTSRYPNLQQVFITSRIYGGYVKNPNGSNKAGCLNPEPYAYEEGFTVQRIIVSQIKQAYGQASGDQFSGAVDYNHAPWFDWGPYLWASGDHPRSDGLVWCMGQNSGLCTQDQRDVRDGDLGDQINFWGDFTHPAAKGAEKVANQLVKFIKPVTQGGSPFVQSWIQK